MVAQPTAMPLACTPYLHPASAPARKSPQPCNPSTLGETRPECFAEGKLPAHIGHVFHDFAERIAAEGPGLD